MTSAPTKPVDVPPYQVQPLIDTVFESHGYNSSEGIPTVDVKCAQALGSEIYVGCSNGELLRFALQANGPEEPESYSLLSRQSLPNDKPIDEIVLAPSISRAFILSDHQIHFYTLPSLDAVPIKPIRNVVALAVDHQQLQLSAPPLTDPPLQAEQVEFCVIKRDSIMLCGLRERLYIEKSIPLRGAFFAKRSGRRLCIADRENYSIVDLDQAIQTPVMPINQAGDSSGPRIRPVITVIAENEFLILSWNGASTMGLFITGDGDPVRGTLEWPSHPIALCLDYPYITTLLPNQTIEVHNLDTQAIVQVIPAPPLPLPSASPTDFLAQERRTLTISLNGFLVPSQEQSEKLRMKKVKLQGRPKFVERVVVQEGLETLEKRLEDLEDNGQEIEVPPVET